MLMLLLPKVSKTHHCLCVSRWTRRGKNPPREQTRELVQRIWRKVFTKAGKERRGGSALIYLDVLSVSVLNEGQ